MVGEEFTCFITRKCETIVGKLDDIIFTFESGTKYSIHPYEYLKYDPDENICNFIIIGTDRYSFLLGAVFYRKYYVIHNFDSK